MPGAALDMVDTKPGGGGLLVCGGGGVKLKVQAQTMHAQRMLGFEKNILPLIQARTKLSYFCD